VVIPKPYYQDAHVTLYHGDCREILPELEAAVMVTDPPFGISYSSGQEGKFKDTMIENDGSTVARDDVLRLWGDRPALVFGSWREPIKDARQAIVWDKGDGVGMGDLSIPWKPNWELIFILGAGFKGSRDTGVISGRTVVSWASKGRLHPNMKPVGLLQMLIHKCPDGVVIDPFAGSCTTGVAAKLEGRHATLIEISERYCEIGAERLRQGVLFR
jgi:site-specific DNA-methyltransferase (adenine-specific)